MRLLFLPLLLSLAGCNNSSDELLVYCAASLQPPLEQLAARYRNEQGVAVRLQYGGSNTLLSQAEISRTGDLLLAADASYLELGRERGVVTDVMPIARMRAVIAVRRGNPRGIQTLDDLLRSDVRLSLASPDMAAIGRTTRELLTASGKWTSVEEAVHTRGVFKPTVGDVAADIQLGAVDAGIVWDAVARQLPELEMIRVAELEQGDATFAAGVLASSPRPAESRRFAEFLAAEDGGLALFRELGYTPLGATQSESSKGEP